MPREVIAHIESEATDQDTILARGPSHPALTGKELSLAVDLRRVENWSYPRIAARFGICPGTATNAIIIAECIAAGHTPAKRDANGKLLAPEVKRLRRFLMEGMKHVEIQLCMAVTAGCVSTHRKRLAADLQAEGKSHLLPRPGNGEAYSGRRLTTATKRKAVQLLMEGYGALRISRETGISKTQIGRIRTGLIKKLAHKGQCLPGCDITGRRAKVKESARFIQPSQAAELRRRLLDREPVKRAARIVGIGEKSAYALRDDLAAEMTAQGQALLCPVLDGSGADAQREVRISRWMPPGKLQRFRTLLIQHGAEEAKRMVIAEADIERRAKASRPKSFEEQLAMVAAGAKLIEKPRLTKPDPQFTLGGVASAAFG